MPKLSVIIPSRDEKFLTPTVDDVLRNARGDTEVVAVLDSNVWPGDWKEVTARHGNRLTTIHNGSSLGMRASINRGAGSAVSRGAQYVMKLDGHCSLSEGFDVTLLSEIEPNWVVIPRRGRLDPENWCATETHKPDIDYHYLSFPDDPNDFGGPGLNGKVWAERAVERKDILVDEEMSSQGSCWLMAADYFQQLELMNERDYGSFWSEFQEIGMNCWLSGGKVMINKKAKYLHLHKGTRYGRGYRLAESALKQGRNHTMKWIWNEAWPKQTLPFKWLIEHFTPVPTWPENWEEILYATRKPRDVVFLGGGSSAVPAVHAGESVGHGLIIHSARYGAGSGDLIDVTEQLRSLVRDDSLDIIVNNSTLTPGQNPYRGKRKSLQVVYSYGEGVRQSVVRDEKEWLIIGQAQERVPRTPESEAAWAKVEKVMEEVELLQKQPLSATALNDYLIRKFSISPQRLKAPMPIELNSFHRNDLALLFAELGFRKGCEVGVAEGHFSEVLLKANPECELLLVDPWHAYSDNPQNKTKEKHEYAYRETLRKTERYSKARLDMRYSLDAVRDVQDDSLDFFYCDANHLFDYCISDLIWWSKKVRSGGICSGDDFYSLDQKRWVGGGVVEAVQAYVNAHRIPIWYVFQGHKSVDFMWCKP